MTYKVGTYQTVLRANPGEHSFKQNDVVLIVGDYSASNKGMKEQLYYKCLNILTGTIQDIRESELCSKFNSETLEKIKHYHKLQIKYCDDIAEALKDIEKEDVTKEEYLLWVITKATEKSGTTTVQKMKQIQKYVDAM